ncbi:hypothetical protein [Candidatus Lariskella endosymbiont of Epinotia ramella]|uniref:hypothetical protein n=1 Tax=Candidatus Lariskella endosymbiont of Epinotia ramella TaxID=3066224 RepID=UPI0030D49E72
MVLYQGTLNISTQQAKFTEDIEIYDKIAQAESKESKYDMHRFKDEEKQVITIYDQLQTRNFIIDIKKSKNEGIRPLA